jgi:hypothetical protein
MPQAQTIIIDEKPAIGCKAVTLLDVGIDPIEKALLKQRLVNLSAGQGGYVEKQSKALHQ